MPRLGVYSSAILALASLWNAAAVDVVPPPGPPAVLVPVSLDRVGSGHAGNDPSLRTWESWHWGMDGKILKININHIKCQTLTTSLFQIRKAMRTLPAGTQAITKKFSAWIASLA